MAKMINVGEIIYSKLKSLVQGRCFPLVAELQTKNPFIVYQVKTTRPEPTKDYYFTEWVYLVEVKIVCDSYDQCFELSEKAVEILDKTNTDELDLQIETIEEDYFEDKYVKSIFLTIKK